MQLKQITGENKAEIIQFTSRAIKKSNGDRWMDGWEQSHALYGGSLRLRFIELWGSLSGQSRIIRTL